MPAQPVLHSPLKPVLPQTTGETVHWGRLQGCAKTMAIHAAAGKTGAVTVLVTTDPAAAARYTGELRFFDAGEAGAEILNFPDWETLPYDNFSPYQDIISERIATLTSLQEIQTGILVVPVSTLMHRLLPGDYIAANSLSLEVGDEIDPQTFRNRLTSCGYRHVNQVMEHGDYTMRGSILDLYPMGSGVPFRIDLFDNEIDSIRIFEVESQRSVKKVDAINVLPAREVPMTDMYIERFRAGWRSAFEGNPGNSNIYTDVSNGIAPAGIEYYLPLFYEKTSLLFDFLPGNSLFVIDEGVREAAEDFQEVVAMRYEQGRHDSTRPLLEPGQLFINSTEVFACFSRFNCIHASTPSVDAGTAAVNYASRLPEKFPVDVRSAAPLQLFNDFTRDYKGRVLLVAESVGRRETIMELFARHGSKPELFNNWPDFLQSDCKFALTVAELEYGASLEEPAITLVSESQLFGERVSQRRLRKRNQQQSDAIIKNLTELVPGAPVVHAEHGVGRYRGLRTIQVNDILCEFIQLEYEAGDVLYVPVAALDLISRYTGVDPEHAPLHRLGSGQWQKARKKAAQKAYDVAAELLELHARRAARQGYSFDLSGNMYHGFSQEFPFEETPGQMQAIDDVLADMNSNTPMDRLICGDSGFGKTEVAMRASFIAVQNSKQVALLVPTTLLAQQHQRNFSDRFADWPVRIRMLSRFVGQNEQKQVLEELEQGQVDIVIGTHKLLQDRVQFRNLGLVIIDEEHRFGVRQKEKFKKLRAEVDVLTLTATPIPRTLNLALSDLRSLSIIATPPSRRLSVKTFLREWNVQLLKEALLREITRGGQVYFLHNEVQSIDSMAAEVSGLIPDARVRIAHGQMPERELEQVMQDFYHRRFNILVCTTIIETGIDVPNANTIVINRADKFGLAQLYQLRGRVGRSHHRAYAYLIVPDKRQISRDAAKRLEAIESLEDLGVGFTLATHDLEIRGAGEILGDEQSGQIQEVGFGMYMDLLERAVNSLRAGRQPELDRPLDHGTEIDFHIPALIPEDYVPDIHSRLIMYKRIASAADRDELEELKEEFIDRYGLLPEPSRNLFQTAAIKLRANPLGIRKIDMGENGGRIWFHEHTCIDPAVIIKLVSSSPDTYKLDGQDKIRILSRLEQHEERMEKITEFINMLSMQDAA